MAILHFDSLPPRTSKGELLKLICDQSGLSGGKVGRLDVQGNRATAEIPDDWAGRLVQSLDGASLNDRRIRVRAESKSAPVDAGDHFQRLSRLLQMESREELRRAGEQRRRLSPSAAERSGTALVDLVVTDVDTGLGGRFILSFVKRNRTLGLPWHRLNSGAPVIVSRAGEAGEFESRGVVVERGDRELRVVIDREPEDTDEGAWRVDLSSDEIASDRQQQALSRAAGAKGDRLTELRRVLLGEREPREKKSADQPIEWELALNPAQQDAVRFALAAEDVALIHGPPGTGKTTTVIELIRQAVRRGEKVLACAPSNLAVDNMMERLVALGESAVRLGHPARVLDTLRQHTLDYLVDEHHDVRLARKLVKEALALFRKASRYTRAKPEPGARQELRQDARSRLADARRLESQAAEDILSRARVVCATTTGLDSQVLGQLNFDLVVIDEACQSTEPGCWPPILRAGRVVLAGDHCQLPPTVISPEAVNGGLSVSLFERLVGRYGTQVTRRLVEQYRMHQSIMAFSSREFYDDELVADASVREHLLTDLSGVASESLTSLPVEFIDTAGADYDEQLEPDGESRCNPREAALVAHKVTAIVNAGVPAADIAVISPYAAQVRLLRERLDLPGLEIDTVDGFQGREKEAVVISLVRSNTAGEIGFLADVRRMNVAMTRARRKLLIVGDSATLSHDPFYARLLEYVEQVGGYRTVWEETL
ncbi:MAG: AAA family ATPase [Planctomycetes bacterium]|nr:AAA family ATPase [Planctomycetota bacterium]